MFCFDPEEEIWSVIPCVGEIPYGRTRHTAVVFNDMMIVYGGRGDNLANFPETIFAYNFTKSRWYEMIIEGELPANGREFHTACVINEKMYVFGGKNNFVSDLGLDVLNLETGRWENRKKPVTFHVDVEIIPLVCFYTFYLLQ
ncbi:hypothetical protein WUBG_13507 [Wuchereria bancrofti]|uniref:Kelch domain-containing protein family protein n=1 Tax=Wuchereria bancrofti TaxID=6293 RepID=J9EF06_WUCBA|nr:hypothetical protein WUBG_13507 [Wuchereria bancrofti]